jgi:hypothetical protein
MMDANLAGSVAVVHKQSKTFFLKVELVSFGALLLQWLGGFLPPTSPPAQTSFKRANNQNNLQIIPQAPNAAIRAEIYSHTKHFGWCAFVTRVSVCCTGACFS